MLEDIVFTMVVFAIGATVLAVVQRRHPRGELRLLVLGFAAHGGAVFAQVWITREVYGGGDIMGYFLSGTEVAEGLRSDFSTVAPELAKVFFHQEDFLLPFGVYGGASATGSQTAVVAGLLYLFGGSLYAVSMAVALWAYFGNLAMFYALEEGLGAQLRKRVLLATTLVPSVVFWSGSIVKEAVAVGAIGFVTVCMRNLIWGRRVKLSALAGVACLVVAAMIKPYVLLPFSIAAGVWFYWERSQRKGVEIIVKPVYLAIAIAVAMTGTIGIGHLFPQYAVDNLVHATNDAQMAGSTVEGGSYYQLADPLAENRSLGRQLAVAPLALITALFRPLLVEARNPMMLLGALETTLLLVFVARLFVRGRFAWVRKTVLASPPLMFCMSFTILLGTAVGLASTNMGSLSRYRIPFMPFFVTLVLVLDGLLRAAPASTPARVRRSSGALQPE